MSLTEWLPILAICVLGAMTPGPSLAVVLHNTMNGSRLHGVVTGISHSLGIAIYALAATTGLALLITGSPFLFRCITWGGAAYLIWLAIKAFRAPVSSGEDESVEKVKTLTFQEAARQGFLISFLNPKIAVFFLALFSQFVTPGAEAVQQAIMVLTATIVDGGWYALVALAFSHPRLLPWLQQKSGVINKLTAVVLLLIAVRILMN
ncbi:LysE family translocator [Parendozoicomonas haliclonae]|uniref:Homoserine/homoserine lactone efflux protein n=1 Tax=Parendozoicomonas haliclonae TaxID=1960125 RepID=A0A1X7AGK5_9GAMM|nr:LysE family translocator [Parendozoicomonas haliclonae]SMA40207.1 Homoserine/homoserine lactone efflux protein [Parendozoicomonas haliclonae]